MTMILTILFKPWPRDVESLLQKTQGQDDTHLSWVAAWEDYRRDLLRAIAKLLTVSSRYQRLQLLEIRYDTQEWSVRLFLDNLKETIPFLILILAAFVT